MALRLNPCFCLREFSPGTRKHYGSFTEVLYYKDNTQFGIDSLMAKGQIDNCTIQFCENNQ